MPKDDKEVTNSVKETVNEQTNVNESKPRSATPWIILFVILLILAVATSCGLLFGYMRRHTNIYEDRGGIVMMRGRGMMGRREIVINNTSTTSDAVLAEGVVTSVGSNIFVIAGNGAQTTVKTSGSTTYNTTDKKVKTNDTVIVEGTKSDSIITASDVRIVNE